MAEWAKWLKQAEVLKSGWIEQREPIDLLRDREHRLVGRKLRVATVIDARRKHTLPELSLLRHRLQQRQRVLFE